LTILGVDGDVQDVKELPGASLGGPVVDQAEAALGLAGQEDVLRHGKGRNQAHLLEDHGDAGPAGGFGRDLGKGLPVDQDRAGVGNMDAVQDLEDRRLPGAVAAKKGVYFALLHLEIDVDQRLDAPEVLGDAAHFNSMHGRCRGHDRTRVQVPLSPDSISASATSSVR
jgi:hypothetical protein